MHPDAPLTEVRGIHCIGGLALKGEKLQQADG